MNMKVNTRVAVTIVYTIFLYMIFALNNVLFHNIVGLIEVSLGLSICFISVITLRINRDNLLNLLAPGIFASTILILLHTILIDNTSNLTYLQNQNMMRQYWIFAMYIIAITFIQALILQKKKINFFLEMLTFLVLVAISIILISLSIIPNVISPNDKFSILYIIFEIILLSLLLFIMYMIFLRRKSFVKYQFYDLEISIILFIIAETFYFLRVDLIVNNEFLVHLFRSLAIIYLSLSLFQRNIKLPLDSIFMEMNQKLNEINEQAKISAKNEKLFRDLYEKAPVSYIILDKNNKFIYVNEMFLKISGYSEEELFKYEFSNLLIQNQKQSFKESMKVLKDSGHLKVVYVIKTKHNKEAPFKVICQLSMGSKNNQEEKHCILFDVSNEIKYQESLLESEKRLSNILNSTDEGIYTVNHLGLCTYINDNAVRILKYNSTEDLLYKNIHEIIHNVEENGKNCPLLNSLETGDSFKAESFFKCGDGSNIPVELFSYPKKENGQLESVIVSFRDITDMKKYKETLFDLSFRDSLTGLYNHRYYQKKIIDFNQEENFPLAVIVGDINGLKMMNDAFGHKCGDELIIKISNAILSCIGQKDLVCRIGGDEFVVLIPNTNIENTKKIVKDISLKVNSISINSINASIALGFSHIFDRNTDFTKVYILAEDDMYREKLKFNEEIKKDALEKINNELYRKDPLYEKHINNVMEYSEKLGILLKLKKHDMDILKKAAFYHDIGKIIVPEEIINKKAKYNHEEYLIMKQHADIGYRILTSIANMKEVADVVLNHHERWDGYGYPQGLKAEKIPLLARIISVSEAFDAMTSYRIFGNKIEDSKAIEELKKCSGTQFDPKIVSLFITLIS